MTPTKKLPFLHRNARSRQIPSHEIREVFAQETTRNLPRGWDEEEYLRKVMP